MRDVYHTVVFSGETIAVCFSELVRHDRFLFNLKKKRKTESRGHPEDEQSAAATSDGPLQERRRRFQHPRLVGGAVAETL